MKTYFLRVAPIYRQLIPKLFFFVIMLTLTSTDLLLIHLKNLNFCSFLDHFSYLFYLIYFRLWLYCSFFWSNYASIIPISARTWLMSHGLCRKTVRLNVVLNVTLQEPLSQRFSRLRRNEKTHFINVYLVGSSVICMFFVMLVCERTLVG